MATSDDRLVTAGVDVGTGAVKTVIFSVPATGDPILEWKRLDRIHRRDPLELGERALAAGFDDLGIAPDAVHYVATTGEGDRLPSRTGHFYSMTCHARGAVHLMPEATAAVDIGALHGKAMRIDPRGKVLSYRMTSQCASGSGRFLESISRYLGVTLEDVGPLSKASKEAEAPSGICAVLAETDVINMVSRGIATETILRGIHVSMAGRLVKLLKAIGVDGPVALTGGLSADVGLVAALEAGLAEATREGEPPPVLTHPHGVFAGAIGAALWGAVRHRRLAERGRASDAQDARRQVS
jgi:benzoyl-CoA reductase subunit D